MCKVKYYLFTFEDAYDDSFGDSHKFTNTKALRSDNFLFPYYDKNHFSKCEISKEQYDEWNEND